MGNDSVLTEAELAAYEPTWQTMQQIETCRRRRGVDKGAFSILDWGCGRGKFVLWLREQGYDAVGVDITPTPFARGADLFRSKGHIPDDCLFVLDDDQAAPFPDASFDVVTSWQTLEHIRDLDRAVAEMHRITASGGQGVHVYPHRRRLFEPHLSMPFVHWLPKNRLRRWSIAACVRLGIDPRWSTEPMTARQRVDMYHSYSVDQTFYRRPAAIRSCFEAGGFEARFVRAPWRNVVSRAAAVVRQALPHLAPDVILVTVARPTASGTPIG